MGKYFYILRLRSAQVLGHFGKLSTALCSVRILGTILFPLIFVGVLNAQNREYAQATIDILSSNSFHGRGYVSKGDSLAAEFIKGEYSKIGLSVYPQGYFQNFNLDVNTFPGAMDVALDNVDLIPGADFLVKPFSTGTYGTFKLQWFEDLLKIPAKKIPKFLKEAGEFNFIIINERNYSDEVLMDLFLAAKKTFNAKGVIVIKEKLTWSVSNFASDLIVLEILDTKISRKSKKINLNIENTWIENYSTRNVIAYKDNGNSDSLIVFTAHYDHLGRMGSKTYFPGANDNASGISLMLDLGKFYQADSIKYDVVFIAFAGEEAGLIGSKHFTENPFFALRKIKFLINMDLMGNGEQGATVVNGTLHEKEFSLISSINDYNHLLPVIQKRGKAQNSDHHFFTENDVPAFFIYTLGGNKAYHDIYDVSATLELQKYDEVFKLITGFVNAL